MPWARFDDKFYAHPKTYRLGKLRLPAIGLHLCAVTWCCDLLTDGIVPADAVTMLGGTRQLAQALVDAGMWHYSDERGEYLIHDFDVYNPTREQVEKRREDWRRRQGRSRKGSRGDSNGVSRRDTVESQQRVNESRSRTRSRGDESTNGIREEGGSRGKPVRIGDALPQQLQRAP